MFVQENLDKEMLKIKCIILLLYISKYFQLKFQKSKTLFNLLYNIVILLTNKQTKILFLAL